MNSHSMMHTTITKENSSCIVQKKYNECIVICDKCNDSSHLLHSSPKVHIKAEIDDKKIDEISSKNLESNESDSEEENIIWKNEERNNKQKGNGNHDDADDDDSNSQMYKIWKKAMEECLMVQRDKIIDSFDIFKEQLFQKCDEKYEKSIGFNTKKAQILSNLGKSLLSDENHTKDILMNLKHSSTAEIDFLIRITDAKFKWKLIQDNIDEMIKDKIEEIIEDLFDKEGYQDESSMVKSHSRTNDIEIEEETQKFVNNKLNCQANSRINHQKTTTKIHSLLTSNQASYWNIPPAPIRNSDNPNISAFKKYQNLRVKRSKTRASSLRKRKNKMRFPNQHIITNTTHDEDNLNNNRNQFTRLKRVIRKPKCDCDGCNNDEHVIQKTKNRKRIQRRLKRKMRFQNHFKNYISKNDG